MRRDAEGMYAFRTDDAGNIDYTFCVEDARAGIELLFLHGEDLRSRLHHHGLLQKVPAGEDIADERRIIDVFIKVAYAITCDSLGKTYLREFKDQGFQDNAESRRLCTCKWYGRYAGCEHRDTADFLPPPLRPIPEAMAKPSDIAAPKRGRKAGSGRTALPAKRRGRAESCADPPATKAAGQKRVSSKTVSKRGASTDQSGATRPCKKPRSGA